MSAESAGGFLSAMKAGGVEAEETSRALMMMSKAGQRMEMSMEHATKGVSANAGMFVKFGIDINQGPERALMRMSKLAHDGKLKAQDLMILFRMQGESARKMMNVMKKGPKHLHEEVEEMRKLGIATQANVDMQARIKGTQNRIKELWEKIQLVVGVRLLPVIDKLLQGVEGQLKGWVEGAAKFGSVLGKFLDQHLTTVVQISKVMAANFALMKATGTGMGGWAGKIGGKAMSLAMPGAAVAGAATAPVYARNRPAAPAPPMSAGIAPRIVRMRVGDTAMSSPRAATAVLRAASAPGKGMDLGAKAAVGVWGAARSAGASIVAGLVSVGRTLLSIGRFLVVGAAFAGVIALIVAAVQMITNNTDAVRTYIMEFWDKFKARVSVIGEMLGKAFGGFGPNGEVGSFFGKLVPAIIGTLGTAVDGILAVIQTIILVIAQLREHFLDAITSPVATFANAWAEANRRTADMVKRQEAEKTAAVIAERTARRSEAPDKRDKQPMTVFNNSKFDITQKFAEGFDPDRIAVAFTNDLASLADRKMQSGFSPLFGV